jgi:hypothetical protein
VYSELLSNQATEFSPTVAADNGGHAYVTGTVTGNAITPVHAAQSHYAGGVFDTWHAEEGDAVLLRLNPDGRVVYSTYWGGSVRDWADAVATDGRGNAYITGTNLGGGFPAVRPFQASNAGDDDAFLAKFDPTGRPMYSSYLGGSSTELNTTVAATAQGRVFVTGYTMSTDFPTAHAAQNRNHGGWSDVFVAELPPSPVPAADSSRLIVSFLVGLILIAGVVVTWRRRAVRRDVVSASALRESS